MPTGTLPPSNTKVGESPKPVDAAAVDRGIAEQLKKARVHVWVADLVGVLALWAAITVAIVIVASLCEHWIAPFGIFGRSVFLAFLAGTGIYFIGWKLAPLLLKRINNVFAARVIEQHDPSLKNSVVNFLYIKDEAVAGRGGMHEVVVENLRRRAAADLDRVQVDSAVDRTTMFRYAYALVGVVAALGAYKVLSPKDPFVTAARVLAPWAQIAPPCRVTIVKITPGDIEVTQGETLTVDAEIEGLRADETPRIVYSTADGRLTDQVVPLALKAGFQFEGKLPASTSDDVAQQGLQQDIIYHIEAGDAVGFPHRVKVRAVSTIDVQRVELLYPEHTARGRETLERTGDVRAVEGTRVTLHARANRAIRSAEIEFFAPGAALDERGNRKSAMRIPLTVVDTPGETASDRKSAQVSFVLMLQADGRPKYDSYQLRFASEDQQASREPVVHHLDVLPDLAPEVEIIRPEAAVTELPQNRTAALEVRALDPDFGLRKIVLKLRRGGTELPPVTLIDDPKGVRGPSLQAWTLDPKALGLNAGDEVRLWAVAEDNRATPKGNSIVDATVTSNPNLSQSQVKSFSIIAPLANEEQDSDENQSPDPSNDRKDPNEKPRDDEKSRGSKSPRENEKPKEDPARNEDPKNSENNKTENEKSPGKKNEKSKNGKKPDGGKPNEGEKSENSGDKSPEEGKSDPEKSDDGKSDQANSEKADPEKEKNKKDDKNQKQKGNSGGEKSKSNDNQQKSEGGAGGESSEEKTSDKGGKSKQKGGSAGQEGESTSDDASPESGEKGSKSAGKKPDGTSGTTSDDDGGNDGSGPSNKTEKGGPGGKAGQPGGERSDEPGSEDGQESDADPGNAPESSKNGKGRGRGRNPQRKLHDGDVIEKALKDKEKQDGANPEKPEGKPESGEAPQPKPDPANPQSGQPNGSPDGQAGGGQPTPNSNGTGQSPPNGGEKSPPGAQGGNQGDAKKNDGTKPSTGVEQAGQEENEKEGGDSSKAGKTRPKTGENAGGGSSPKTSNGRLDEKSKANDASGGKQPKPNDPSTDPERDPNAPDKLEGAGDSGTEGSGNPDTSKEKGGSGAGQKENADRNKDPKKDKGKAPATSDPGGVSQSKKQSDSKGGASGDESGGGGKGSGQSGKQKGNDSPGSQSAGDRGNGAAKEEGQGEVGDKAGQQQQAGGKTGQSGDKAGDGSASKANPGGNLPNEGGGPAKDPTQAPSDGAGGKKEGNSKGSVVGGGAPTSGDSGPNANATPGEVPEGDEANEAYARKATDLALQHLRDQKDNSDSELLKELGWTKEELQSFLDRWDAMKKAAERNSEAAERLDEAYKSLGIRPAADKRRGTGNRSDNTRDLRDSGNRSDPPSSYADQFRAFRKGAGNKTDGSKK